eukprot:Awhi_evm1s14549
MQRQLCQGNRSGKVVGPLKETLESGLKEALDKDQLTILRPQFYREMCQKAQRFNSMKKFPN